MKKNKIIVVILIFLSINLQSQKVLIPMDNAQNDHLKAYGLAYFMLVNGFEVEWLLNYRGGSFMMPYGKPLIQECILRGISYEILSESQAIAIYEYIADPSINADIIKLTKAPRIAVYAPPTNLPWDDAVTLVLTYADIPYDQIYDKEVLQGILPTYDWLHIHHEDFTGQFGKFWAQYKNTEWYQKDQQYAEQLARSLGFTKVSQLKLAVAKNIRDYVAGGGYLFAMCSAPESIDIALAADGVDICDVPFDGDPPDPNAQNKLDYSKTFAFTNFKIYTNPYIYAKSDIDVTMTRPQIREEDDYFALFEFSAKWDPVPTMLCQNHERIIKGFMGQATAFNKSKIKKDILIMGENKSLNEARYIHGEYGRGTFTFYGGHDPEDYRHFVYDPPTDLNLFKNSPGYRLILNNVLFPAAQKKKLKT